MLVNSAMVFDYAVVAGPSTQSRVSAQFIHGAAAGLTR